MKDIDYKEKYHKLLETHKNYKIHMEMLLDSKDDIANSHQEIMAIQLRHIEILSKLLRQFMFEVTCSISNTVPVEIEP